MSDAIRQIRARARRKAAGLVRLEFWVPADRRDQIRVMVAAALAEDADGEEPSPVPAIDTVSQPVPPTPAVPGVDGRRRRLFTDIDGLLD